MTLSGRPLLTRNLNQAASGAGTAGAKEKSGPSRATVRIAQTRCAVAGPGLERALPRFRPTALLASHMPYAAKFSHDESWYKMVFHI